ncbi:MAG: hypothetical protein ACM3QV_00335 [Caulobacteraceae bacterium]
MRVNAVHSLSVPGYNLKEKRVVKYIADMLDDESAIVRQEAAMSLGKPVR